MGCKDMAKVKWGKRRRRRRRQEGVERRMKKLQRLVPGGAGMNPDLLFLKTAEHILQLRLQLNVLQALSKIFNA
ncbi:Transcription factor IBH1 [Spatholobus suberectus]|nr:Transcription factor IBH1 [Spatholobus suberectus]